MLEAKLIEKYRWPTIVALEGQEYVKDEWRPVPPEREDEAKGNALLEVREREEAVIAEPASEAEDSLLDGSIAAVSNAVAAMESVEALNLLVAAEAEGKARKGVAEAIEARIAELAE